MKPRTGMVRRTLTALALGGALALAEPAQAQTPAQTPFGDRVEGLLRQTGYNFNRVKAGSWYILFSGKELTSIRVLIGAGPSSIAVGAVAVPKAKLSVSAESMYQMMKLSYDLNYVRMTIDPDGDLLAMSQVKQAWLDLAEFKDVINRVVNAADRAYKEMRPYIAAP